ncbi:hypothetical protein [Paracoccus rhizosphaerae]|uniref:Uncharacterized protein n=1 Tax=Paracoccus rhizosphaerae TaxID=1133347 RepID=A0ABV6CNM4_9RHOB|nr:hypothetical protein [Paracoccus rhizosphaerae]
MLRLAALSVAAFLAQATTAVALVWTGIAVLNLGREALTELGVRATLHLSTRLVAGVGLWLALRGLRMLKVQTHHHHDTCGCGHVHGPTPAQVRNRDRCATACWSWPASRPGPARGSCSC